MIVRFDDYVLDIERRELRRVAAPVALEPQVFALLGAGRIVSDWALTTRFNAARQAVNDSGAACHSYCAPQGHALYRRGVQRW